MRLSPVLPSALPAPNPSPYSPFPRAWLTPAKNLSKLLSAKFARRLASPRHQSASLRTSSTCTSAPGPAARVFKIVSFYLLHYESGQIDDIAPAMRIEVAR